MAQFTPHPNVQPSSGYEADAWDEGMLSGVHIGDTPQSASSSRESAIHFSKMSVTPTMSDLSKADVHVSKNRVSGAYSSAEQYLNTQFRLLREDLISGLRKGVARIRDGGATDSKILSDVKAIYRNLTIVSPKFGQTGLTFFVELDMSESLSRRICKEETEYLLTGSLLCMTCDAFHTNCLFAVVADCDLKTLKEKHGFEISFLPESLPMYQSLDNKTGPFIALESEAYLEAYSHVLKSLQLMYARGLPLERYIAFCETDIHSVEGRDNFKVLDAQGEPVKKLRTLLSCANESDDVSGELGLNDSQYRAYISALHQQLSIIQGPPGTGKTHVGLRIMRTLLYNLYDNPAVKCPFSESFGPILVICYTNHALDQFLEGLLEFCEARDIVRVGGGSKSELMKECTIDQHNDKIPGGLRKRYSKLLQQKDDYEIRNAGMSKLAELNTSILPYRTSQFIGYGRLYRQFDEWHRKYDPRAGINVMAVWLECDEERRQPPGHIRKMLAIDDVTTADEFKLMNTSAKFNIHDLNLESRWRLYRYLVRKYIAMKEKGILSNIGKYQDMVHTLNLHRVEMNMNVMAACKVVGMTTTGAAKYRESLHIVGPKIVIAEEAAEVLEAHITTALTCHCEQLILIGDHKQLRPNPAAYEMEVKYHLGYSMFERFVNNGLPHITLNKQHRMRPEISVFVRNVYGRLDDHESVHGREPIRGVTSCVTFFNHEHQESASSDATSKCNMFEVEMVTGLVRFLVQQDYDPADITVITMYSRQMFELKRKLSKRVYPDLTVTSVDDFQGEENKIIILSLVRSNNQDVAGFVAIDNRVCVALSRARDGMFVFGNFNLFKRSSNLWAKIVADAEKEGVLVDSIKVTCPHRPQPEVVRKPEDFSRCAPDGGCTKNCGEKLACGHICRLKCHYSHVNYECCYRCERSLANCSHRCRLLCYEKCQPCQVSVQVKLPCGHLQQVACHVSTGDLTDVDCAVDCRATLECGHKCRNKCSKPCTDMCCQNVRQTCTRCGRENTTPCHQVTLSKLNGLDSICRERCNYR